ncbi:MULTISPECIES: LysE family translocator [Galbibacter]|uniref:LysE family transporter n=1 Tax=Galbibacter pacificus TaxID=2996052 RepID=A0ABT6FRK6_9FLAO|nr:LysE family transporter [Galbibacter pacificus]MDG3582988.1 LysE family transporter [Galbibacter pacificus]MDG3585893.1 LysE family transporter [Galbibacter pacificus]
MIEDVFSAIPLGILLAFTIGPVFFVLLETGAIKGFRAALSFDLGVVMGDSFFIIIAYFSTNKILHKIKDDPSLFIFGGILLIIYGIISFLKTKSDYKRDIRNAINQIEVRRNYFKLFFKGFLLNFINVGVLGFWLGIIIIFGPKLEMNDERIFVFLATILATYLFVDCIKIILAKQLRNKLTPRRIFKIKRIISVILVVFGVALMLQGIFPNEKKKIQNVIEDIRER